MMAITCFTITSYHLQLPLVLLDMAITLILHTNAIPHLPECGKG